MWPAGLARPWNHMRSPLPILIADAAVAVGGLPGRVGAGPGKIDL